MAESPVRAFTMAAAGHAANNGSSMYEEERAAGDDRPGILLKPLDTLELDVYQRLATLYVSDPIQPFVPAFHGILRGTESGFLRLDNLLHGFSQPKVMDIKLGLRTYLNSETRNTKPRADLFKKMLVDFPSDLTPAELEMQKVTKSRYMAARDANSTSGFLGFRVSGTAGCYGGPGTTSKYRSSISDSQDAAYHAFRVFARSASGDHDESPAQIAKHLVEHLGCLRSACEASTFVKRHECVGTSALLVVDAASGQCRVFWIDFAKTYACEDEQGLTHREALSDDSQEEGLLIGLDNLIAIWKSVGQSLQNDEVLEGRVPSNCCKSVLLRHKSRISSAIQYARSLLKTQHMDSPLVKGSAVTHCTL